ncbi:MAG: hypothetical protein KGJ23_00675 [Euryarchaeota archaeon]|nr:hypothetical protein [Euryarchaeota archaeon]MDE1835110.1 hypothetical protein [Euryarchaeota archaeon]MDE1880704.1 hypothetical protein [Euryarchaeota archaeon]MDE2044927.1 hypothetical protein [Thermoplasmata archaeon]
MPARTGEGGTVPRAPPDWVEEEKEHLERLRSLPTPVKVEQGLHPPEHACAACTAARALRALFEREKVPILWVEVAHVLPGQEGVAAPPPWLRILLPGEETGPVRFLGPPRGDLLEGLTMVLRSIVVPEDPPPLLPGWKDLAARSNRHHHLRVFAAARNADAPPVIRTLGRFVHLKPERWALDVIDVETFPREARRRAVRHLPTVTIDDFAHFYGPPDEEELLEAVRHVMPSGALPYLGVKGESPFGGVP